MLPLIIAGLILCAIGYSGVYLGLKLFRLMHEHYDEHMAQRMVDYNGFVDVRGTTE